MITNRGKAIRTVLLTGGAAMILPFAAAPAFAQSGASEEDGNNTIIVTAQRRNENLEDVPMTVQVVTAETLATSGVNTIRDLANVTTGFQVGQGGSYPQPAIRGVTALAAGAYENNVAVFVDGLYQATPQVINMDLPNVQDVQILKGPQGTLYGRNATGGAILINTIEPGNDWQGQVEATYARFNDYRGRAFVAGPISDKVGISLAGTLRHTDGYYKIASRSTPGQFDGRGLPLKQESFRAKLRFDLSESFRATLAYNYTRASDGRGVVFTPIENVPNSYLVGSGRETRPTGLGEVSGDVFDLNFRQHEGSLKLELDTGIGKLRSVSGYSLAKLLTRFDFNGSYVPDLISPSDLRDRNMQQTIDLTVDSIKNLDLIVGATYYNIKFEYDPNTPSSTFLGPASFSPFTYPNPGTTTVPLTDYRRSADTFFFRTKEAWAVFADATFHATDRISVTVGGRYSKEKQDVSGYKLNYVTATGPTLGSVLNCAYSRNGETNGGLTCLNGASAKTSNYSKFTPRASIRYEINPGTNIYASYTNGFRGGEWNGAIPGDNPANWFDVKQETVDSFEVGFKSAGRRLRFELAGFYSKYKDLQVSFTSQVGTPPTALVILQNAPSASIYGAEASFDFKANDNLTLRGGASWLHARYGNNFFFTGSGVNPLGTGFLPNADPLKVFPNATLSQDLSGLQMARAPDFSGFLGFDFNIPNGDGGLRFSANVKYSASYVVTNPSVWGGDATYNARIVDADPSNNGPPVNTQIFTAAGAAGAAFVSRASEQRARQGAFALVNASVTWTDPSDHYYVRVWGNNLTDVKYRTHFNPLASGTYQPIAEPLSFGGTIGYKF
jgi:iron complex outermembrane receptor protein